MRFSSHGGLQLLRRMPDASLQFAGIQQESATEHKERRRVRAVKLRLASLLIKNHHLGHERLDVVPVYKRATARYGSKIFTHIALEKRLVIALGKAPQDSIVIWLIATLERIDQDQPAVRFEHTRCFSILQCGALSEAIHAS